MIGKRYFDLTREDYEELVELHGGFCTACGEEHYGIEPDAEGYECELCGDFAVYGIEQLMLLGRITIQSRKGEGVGR